MKFLSLQVAGLFAGLLAAQGSIAQNTLISEDEALKNFTEAAKLYREGQGEEMPANAEESADVEQSVDLMDDETTQEPVVEFKVEDKKPETASLVTAEPIENTVVQINIENKTLEEVVAKVIKSTRIHSGEWKVKWRLSPKNNYIRDERVNITAETDLNGFMKFLADRVNNMTGVQLFVTVFDKAHIIVISDTYY